MGNQGWKNVFWRLLSVLALGLFSLGSPLAEKNASAAAENWGKVSGQAAAPGIEFLIVSDPNLVPAANELAEWKTQRGWYTQVVDTRETGVTSEAIQNYLRQALNTWAPSLQAVLLLGDVEAIPTFSLRKHFDAGAGLPYPAGVKTATDWYYAAFDGSMDSTPAFALGRLPADTLSEAYTAVRRSIAYEFHPPSGAGAYRRATLAGEFVDADLNGVQDTPYITTLEALRAHLHSAGFETQRLYTAANLVTPQKLNLALPVPDELLKPGFGWNAGQTDVNQALQRGDALWVVRADGQDDGWPALGWSQSDLQDLVLPGLPPLMVLAAHENGRFDAERDTLLPGAADPGLAESLLRRAEGGPVAVIAPTRRIPQEMSDRFVEGLIDALWPGLISAAGSAPAAHLGAAMQAGRDQVIAQYGAGNPLTYSLLEGMHVLGDPTLAVWTQAPGDDLTVATPATMLAGAEQMRVEAPAGALVAVAQNAHLLGRATAQTGETLIPLVPALAAGTVTVTVTQVNQRPVQKTIPVEASTEPLPAAPGNLLARSGRAPGYDTPKEISLSWEDLSANETQFLLERSPLEGGDWSLAAALPAGQTSYLDENLPCGTHFRYRLKARGSGGDSGYSNLADAATLLCPALPGMLLPPNDLSATVLSATEVWLTWNLPVTDASGTRIERYESGGYQTALEVGAGTDEATLAGLPCGKTVYFKARSLRAGAASDATLPVSVTLNACSGTPPPAPAGLSAAATGRETVSVAWTDAGPEESGYVLERSRDGWSGWVVAQTPAANSTRQEDGGLSCGTGYSYRLRGKNAAGLGAWAGPVFTATFPCAGAPSAPASLTAVRRAQGGIFLTWADSSNNELGFRVERSADGLAWVAIATLGPDVTGYFDPAPALKTAWYYRVSAINAAGASAFSNQLFVTEGQAVYLPAVVR